MTRTLCPRSVDGRGQDEVSSEFALRPLGLRKVALAIGYDARIAVSIKTSARKAVPASLRRPLGHFVFAARSFYRGARSSYRRRVLHRRATLPRLDIQVTDHCNLACRSCNHFSPLSPPAFASLDDFDRDIRRLAELCDNIEWLNLVGGEPLLHPNVLDFARAARRAFPSAGIALYSNGLILRKMPDGFWRNLKILAGAAANQRVSRLAG